MPIPQILIHKVTRADQPNVSSSTTELKTPAEKVVWIRKDQYTGGFSAIGCIADDLADLDVFVSTRMISDHTPHEYEESLGALATENAK